MGSTSLLTSDAQKLIAVLLITRSRPGPKLIFHYPAHPTTCNGKSSTGKTSLRVDDSDSSDASDDELLAGSVKTTQGRSAVDLHDVTVESPNPQQPSRLLGYMIDSLEKTLAPDVWSDRSKFELTLDDLTFVGHPVHANHEGQWSRVKAETEPTISHIDTSIETLRRVSHKIQGDPEKHEHEHEPSTKPIGITSPAVNITLNEAHDFTHIPESLDSQLETSLGTSLNSMSSASEVNRERLSMFHVVFVCRTGYLSSAGLYKGVVKTMSKALNYCQKQNNFVTTEIRKIMSVRAKMKPEHQDQEKLLTEILAVSELARALKDTFDHISTGDTACFKLNGNQMSVRVSDYSTGAAQQFQSRPAAHQTLLLLDKKKNILKELVDMDASPLAVFIREQTPTKSLHKHAVKLGVPVEDVLYLAQHLIYWRKARLISPLRPSNIYTVNPHADLTTIKERTSYYNKHFMALPSLALMLKVLSGRPIKYVMLIPSRDHREHYMDMLTCLVRDGLVVQLKTYGWLTGRLGERTMLRAVDRTIAQTHLTPSSLLSPHLRPVEDDSVSVSSGRTTIQRSGTPLASIGNDREADKRMIILDPESTSPEEDRLIEQISASIQDVEIRNLLPTLIPYFNGEQVLEDISAREGFKRALVDRAIEVLEQDQKHLLTYRSV